MTTKDAASPTQAQGKQLAFERYVLDLDRGSLAFEGVEVALRPKAFSLLRFFVGNAGRLLAKDDLAAALWPNMAITDDVLVQSIGDLRRALGPDGARLIKTVPRRGYRFEAEVSDFAPQPPAPLDSRTQLDFDGQPVANPTERGDSHLDAIEDKPTMTVAAVANSDTLHADSRWRQYLEVLRTLTARQLGIPVFWRTAAGVLAIVTLFGASIFWSTGGLERGASGAGALKPLGRGVSIAATSRPAIAILPFVDQSDEPNRQFFADGMTQDIINALGRYSALTVMSWNAVQGFKVRPNSPTEIAQSLGVRYFVEGSIRRYGDRVRVGAQLVADDGHVLWSDRFEEGKSDIFAVQDSLITHVAGALATRVSLSEQVRVLAKPTDSLEAYDLMLAARPALQRPTRSGIIEARRLLRAAIKLDAKFAGAYGALAETYDIDVTMGWAQSPSSTAKLAEDMANKALSLDDSQVKARIILGRIHILYQNYEQAQKEMDRALSSNPSDAQGLAGRGTILLFLGRSGDAIGAFEQAYRIDPEPSALYRHAFSLAYYLHHRYESAIEQAELSMRRTDGVHFPRAVLAASYAQLNKLDEARMMGAELRRLDPTFDLATFGQKLRSDSDRRHLLDGLTKAGLNVSVAKE